MRAWPLLFLSLCGCGDTPLRSTWADLSRRLPAGDPVPAEAATEGEAEGGPALQLRVGGRAARAALVSEQGERRLWRAGAGIVVATDGGRVVATSGLREVLVATRFDGPDPLASSAELLDRPAEARRLVDLIPGALTVDSDVTPLRQPWCFALPSTWSGGGHGGGDHAAGVFRG